MQRESAYYILILEWIKNEILIFRASCRILYLEMLYRLSPELLEGGYRAQRYLAQQALQRNACTKQI